MTRAAQTVTADTSLGTGNLASEEIGVFASLIPSACLETAIEMIHEAQPSDIQYWIEQNMIVAWRNFEARFLELMRRNNAYYADVEVNGLARFQVAVNLIAFWLEPNGTLHVARKHDFFTTPRSIADELVNMGHMWVMASMVEAAQRQKRGKVYETPFRVDGAEWLPNMPDYNPVDLDVLLYGEGE